MPTGADIRQRVAESILEKKRGANGQQLPYLVNEKDRNLVCLSRACGLSYESTAELIGVSVSTVRKHYAHELEHGAEKITTMIAANLVQTAMQRGDLKAANTAAIFWLKTRGGFSERATQEVGIESLGPVRVTLRIGDREPAQE